MQDVLLVKICNSAEVSDARNDGAQVQQNAPFNRLEYGGDASVSLRPNIPLVYTPFLFTLAAPAFGN